MKKLPSKGAEKGSSMKARSIAKYALKNLFHNFSRSSLALITIVLLAAAIIFIGNLCYTLKATIDSKFLSDINASTEFTVTRSGGDIFLTAQEMEKFERDMIKLKIYDSYTVGVEQRYYIINDSIGKCYAAGYLSGIKNSAEPEILSGEHWGDNDIGKDYIWVNSSIATEKNICVGDSVEMAQLQRDVNENSEVISSKYDERNFIVKGIVSGDSSYIDVSKLDVKYLSYAMNNHKFENLSMIKKLNKLDKSYQREMGTTQQCIIIDNDSMRSFVMTLFNFILIVCLIIIGLAVALCIGCVLNTLKISIENNAQTIGIMRSLGMKNRDIHSYLFVQIAILIVLAVVIAMLISWALGAAVFPMLVGMISGMLFGSTVVAIGASFNILIPIISVFGLIGIVFLATFKMLRRYLNKSTISVLQEVAE